MEDTKFFRCEFDVGSPDRHLMAGGIHRETVDPQHGCRRRCHIVPTKYRPDVRQQFTVVRGTKDEIKSCIKFSDAIIRLTGFFKWLQDNNRNT